MRHIDYGLGCFSPSGVYGLPAGPADLADCISRSLSPRDELAAVEVPERFYETGSFAGIRELSMR